MHDVLCVPKLSSVPLPFSPALRIEVLGMVSSADHLGARSAWHCSRLASLSPLWFHLDFFRIRTNTVSGLLIGLDLFLPSLLKISVRPVQGARGVVGYHARLAPHSTSRDLLREGSGSIPDVSMSFFSVLFCASNTSTPAPIWWRTFRSVLRFRSRPGRISRYGGGE